MFASEIGGDIFDITAAWAIFMIVTGVLTIQVGKLGDWIEHEYLLLLGYALNTVLTFSFLLIETPMQLFMVQAGLGVSLALAAPPGMPSMTNTRLQTKTGTSGVSPAVTAISPLVWPLWPGVTS